MTGIQVREGAAIAAIWWLTINPSDLKNPIILRLAGLHESGSEMANKRKKTWTNLMPPATIRKPPWISLRAEEALHHETHTVLKRAFR